MELKYGNLFEETAHMHRHRVGARGNATTFLLPWESILSELHRIDREQTEQGHGPNLPRTPAELTYVVQILLKTGNEDEREELKHFMHQANVNRNKVIACILGMKNVATALTCA